MTLSRGGHLKASRNGLIFGRLLQFFFYVVHTGFFLIFLCCADWFFSSFLFRLC
ncbi:uncharacterized protein DS421_8g233650 [Arachis hypogaea]|nr:uncharacterized protein DS421_8g233650 [Arachis hypogaea]